MVVTHAHSSSATPPAKRTRTDGGGGGQGQQISVQFRSRMRHKQTKRGATEKAEVFTKFVLRKENLVSGQMGSSGIVLYIQPFV